jgi:hypothetical protein
MASYTVRVRDYSDEYTSLSLNVGDLASLDTISVAEGHAGDLATALDALMLGTIVGIGFNQTADEGADTRPASGEAQREKGMRFFFHEETNNRKGSFTVPTADFGTYAQPGTDLVDLDDVAIAALVTWVEANVEIDGIAVVVDRAVLVGRNS